jgi:hypothetical protein
MSQRIVIDDRERFLPTFLQFRFPPGSAICLMAFFWSVRIFDSEGIRYHVETICVLIFFYFRFQSH